MHIAMEKAYTLQKILSSVYKCFIITDFLTCSGSAKGEILMNIRPFQAE